MSSTPDYFAGVDMGAAFTKAVLVGGQKILGFGMRPSGGRYRETAEAVLEEALARAGLSREQLAGIGITGLGAENAPFSARPFSDISCQARGCRFHFPLVRTVIDIGGQFTKAARLTPEGRVADFLISEKCATGSGRFLQVMARILQIDWEAIGPLSLKSKKPVEFSTGCAVFAESETVSRLAEGARPEDLLAGMHRAMASKVAMLVKRLKMEPEVVLTGGGAEDVGLVRAVSEALGLEVRVPEHPRLTAALGSACLTEGSQP
ncbi:MAG: 2-hydroxyglutaryl-CoA dehydratase [Deltaproteobacteria bacterium]|nr:2-hydroxyglutaryl-CoA dehydratase [Deltaproteobacteria bacterium]